MTKHRYFMKRIVVLFSLLALLTVSRTQAQSMGSEYKFAVGVKLWPGGLTAKYFIRDNRALEGIAYFWEHGFRFTGLYEFHGDINGAPGLKWYVGPGAHVGFYDDDYKHAYPERDAGVDLGVDGVIGLDYKIKNAPINLSLDWQPSFTIVSHPDF